MHVAFSDCPSFLYSVDCHRNGGRSLHLEEGSARVLPSSDCRSISACSHLPFQRHVSKHRLDVEAAADLRFLRFIMTRSHEREEAAAGSSVPTVASPECIRCIVTVHTQLCRRTNSPWRCCQGLRTMARKRLRSEADFGDAANTNNTMKKKKRWKKEWFFAEQKRSANGQSTLVTEKHKECLAGTHYFCKHLYRSIDPSSTSQFHSLSILLYSIMLSSSLLSYQSIPVYAKIMICHINGG